MKSMMVSPGGRDTPDLTSLRYLKYPRVCGSRLPKAPKPGSPARASCAGVEEGATQPSPDRKVGESEDRKVGESEEP